jgi:WD40 repeat protein
MTDSDPDSTTNINRSGGADLNAGRDITVGGDVIGRDKISVTNITDAQQYDVSGLANPYLGLQSFTYADHAKYAGREKLIAETVARLTAPDDPLALLFVTGASGSGKSSFVQAGVLPALEKYYTALSVKWAVFRPSRDPLATLADALWRQLGLPAFDTHTTSLADFGDFLQTHTPSQQVNLIVIDQFEELFTQSNAQPRDALFALLTQLPPFRSTRTHIIATVRADYLPELFALPTLYDIAKRGIDLRAMSVDELREAIQQPLRAAYPDKDKRFQTELVERLAHDTAEDAAYLPLLQVTLEEIWRKGALMLGSYTTLTEPIKQRADKVLAYQDFDAAQPDQPRPPEEQAAILNLCLDLVDVSLDDEARRDVRRRRTKDELVSGVPERVRQIDTLAQARLLSVSTESGEQTHVEVDLIHETLLSNWDRLRQVIAGRRHELRQRVRFEQQLKEWVGQNRSADYLLDGVRLAEARELERRDDVALRSTDAKDFVRGSVVAAESAIEREKNRQQQEIRRLRTRNRVITAVGAIALVLGIVAVVFAVQSNAQQRLSRSRELAAVAISQLDIDPERSILVALEANNASHTFEAEDGLRRALFASRIVAALRGHTDQIWNAQFSPDGKQIVTASSDQTARVWDAATGKEVAVLRGHEGQVNSAQFSPDSKQIVTASDDTTARIWDAVTGEEVAVLRGHGDRVISAKFSPDGKQIVTASSDQTARVWDAAAGKEVALLRGHEDQVNSLEFSPDSKRIVTASDDTTARVWDTVTGKEVAVLRGHEGWVSSAQFSPDGKQIVTASLDKTARVWDAATGKELVVLRGHEGWVNSAQFSPDGKQIVTASDDTTARMWNAATGKELSVLRGHDHFVMSAQFSLDGKQIVTASDDTTARVWDAATGKELAVLRGHEDQVNSAQFLPDGKQIATVSSDATARIWDAVTGKEVAVLRGHEGGVLSAQISPDSRQIATASSDNTARVWDAVTGREIAVLRGHEDTVNGVQFSPDGRQIVTASWDKTARVWDAATGKEVAVLRGHEDWVNSAQFSPDGKQIVTASSDKTARVWDTATGQEMAVLRGHGSWVRNAQFSPDGKWIVTASLDKTARVWEAATGKEVAVLRGHESGVNSAQFSPDGRWIVTVGGDKTARVWQVADGKEVAVFHGHEDGVLSAQFSPDGKQIVTISLDKTARVWDTATGQEVAVLSGHERSVDSAQFSPDGKRIVTGECDRGNGNNCYEGTARVWNVATGQVEVVLRGHKSFVNGTQFSPDGKYIVTASDDGTARVYLVHIEDLIELAKKRLTRELTCEERVQYLHEDRVCPTPEPPPTP